MIKRFLLPIFYGFCLILFSCAKSGSSQEYHEQSACDIYDKIIEEESQNLPVFSCPPILVEDFKIEGTPDYLKWYTCEPKDYSSKALKKGGSFYAYLNDIPNTFRYAGPEADDICVKLFNTQMPFLWQSLETLEFMPSAATHWAADLNSKTAYYKLNENMLWSDGKPCTADDWVFAWEFFQSKEIVDPVKNYKFKRLSVKKINDYCVSVTVLKDIPFSDYELLDMTNFKPVAEHFYGGIVPKDWVIKYNRVAEPTTGPYYLKSYDYNNGLKFVKVKNWWGHCYPHFKGIANFEEIFYRIIAGRKNPAFSNFYSGAFDTITLENPAERRKAEKSQNVTAGFINLWYANYVPVSGASGIFFNTREKPFDNEFVRKGMYYALDMDGLVEIAFSGENKRLHTLGVGQQWEGYSFNDTDILKPRFNPKKAADFFVKAGYDRLNSKGILVNANGEELSFTIIYTDELERELFGYLYAQALKAGVNIEFKYFSSGIIERLSKGKYQAWWGKMTGYRIPDSYSFLHSSYADKYTFNNFFGYSDPKLDALLEKYDAVKNYSEKAELNRKIEKLVDEAALMVPSYYNNSVKLLAWKWICFPAWLNMKYQAELVDPMFGYLWVDPQIEEECKKAMAEHNLMENRIYVLSSRYK